MLALTKQDIGKYFRTRNGLYAVMTSYDNNDPHYPCGIEVLSAATMGWAFISYTQTGKYFSHRVVAELDIVERVDTENALAELALMGVEPPDGTEGAPAKMAIALEG